MVTGVTGGPGPDLLVAFVAWQGNPQRLGADLRSHLRGLLPGPLIPAVFHPVTAFPLLSNGKADRKQLARARRPVAGCGLVMTAPTGLVRIHRYGDNPAATRTLYCFAHAGGTAPFFRPWRIMAPKHVEIRAIQLPGRQDLYAMPAFTDMSELVSAVTDTIVEDAADGPYAFFGHSMGALTAFETAREMRRRDVRPPTLLGLSGHRAPQLPKILAGVHLLPDAELIDRLRALGGIPDDVLQHPDLLAMAMPAIRADATVLAGYEFVPESPLACRFAVFGGVDDGQVPEDALDAWRVHSTDVTTVERFCGDHFYLTRWASRIMMSMFATPVPS